MSNLGKIKFLQDFDLRLMSIVEWRLAPREGWAKMSFDITHIWLVLSGKRQIELNGNKLTAAQGDLVVIPSDTPRIVYPDHASSEPFHYITHGLQLKLSSLDFANLYQFPLHLHLNNQYEFQELVRLSRILLHYTDQILIQFGIDTSNPHGQSGAEAINRLNTEQTLELLESQQYLYLWFSKLMQAMRSHLPKEPLSIDQRVLSVCDYIKRNLHCSITLSDLAKYAMVSESHLRLLFRKSLNAAPMEYVRNIRIQRAKDLLANTSCSLREISSLVGYEDQSKFSTVFKRMEGISAKDYRKLAVQLYREEGRAID